MLTTYACICILFQFYVIFYNRSYTELFPVSVVLHFPGSNISYNNSYVYVY